MQAQLTQSKPSQFLQTRRDRAGKAVRTYINNHVADDSQAAITDLIADLGHFADALLNVGPTIEFCDHFASR